MKNIKKYLEFIKESKLMTINEGGGAGKNFTFHGTTFKIEYTFLDGKLTISKNEFNLGDKLDIVGYQDGLSDINNVDLFKSDNKMICNFDENMAKEILSISNADMDIKHTFTFEEESYGDNDYSVMIGAGYLYFKFDENDVVLPKLEVDGYDFSIDYDDYDHSNNYYDIKKILENVKVEFPDMIATEKFQDMWIDIFDPISYEDSLLDIVDKDDIMSEEDYYSSIQDDLIDIYCE